MKKVTLRLGRVLTHHGLPNWAKLRACVSAVRFRTTPGSRPVA